MGWGQETSEEALPCQRQLGSLWPAFQVLFEDAWPICRIKPILSPRATPCWWGGRQRQASLSALAAYISALEVFHHLKKGYGS